MKSKFWSRMANFILLLPLIVSSFVGVGRASAASPDPDTPVTVTLHKRVFSQGQVPAAQANTGAVDDNFGGRPLAGVTFTAYDVTDHYLGLRTGGNTAEQATQAIQNDAANAAPSYATSVGSQVTAGADGTAVFSNLPSKDGDKDKVYLFVETQSPTNITQKAAPIVLALPIYTNNSDTQVNSDIHVYPKNEQTEPITKDLDDASKQALDVTLPDGTHVYNAAYGQSFGYTLRVAVPWNIDTKSTFTVVDTPNLGIDDDASTVNIAGLTRGTDYTVAASDATSTDGRGFTITFNPTTDAVKAQAGKQLTINYQATLTNAAVPDAGDNNTATLNIGDNNGTTSTPVTGPTIYTGGIKFVKQDKQSNADLADAEFQLVKVNASGTVVSYATQASDGSYTWNDTSANATTYTSAADGTFELKGLQYSNYLSAGQSYALIETKAPTGYAQLTDPITFTITRGSYDATATRIDNIKKGILPSTGGAGIYLFLIIGAALMAGAYTWNQKNKKDQNI